MDYITLHFNLYMALRVSVYLLVSINRVDNERLSNALSSGINPFILANVGYNLINVLLIELSTTQRSLVYYSLPVEFGSSKIYIIIQQRSGLFV